MPLWGYHDDPFFGTPFLGFAHRHYTGMPLWLSSLDRGKRERMAPRGGEFDLIEFVFLVQRMGS